MIPPLTLSNRYPEAVAYAWEAHSCHWRKETMIPYLAHLIAVSALVLEHGGSEDQAIAGLLHDAAEDQGGQPRLDDIRDRFGDIVADIVLECTDSLAEDATTKAAWWPRKVAYLEHLANAPADALLVSAADKLHNARSILGDYRVLGDELWTRFNPDAGRLGSLWYYGRLVEIFEARLGGIAPANHLVDELQRTVESIRSLARGLGHDVATEDITARALATREW